MTKTTYNDNEVIRFKYFYDLFLKRKRLYPSSYFMFVTKTRKKQLPLEKKLFKKIISTYLDIYFNEFYFEEKPKYFMLSGELDKALGARTAINSKKGIFREINSIGWVWYLRPSIPFVSNIRLIKLKGSTSRVGKLEKKYCEKKDIAVLTPINIFMAKIIELKKLFKND
jgi:hypothetical protein